MASPARRNGSEQEEPTHRPPLLQMQGTSFTTQANALLRKNLTFQKRNKKTNGCIITIPFFLCLLLFGLQTGINAIFSGSEYKCGCQCVRTSTSGCEEECGVEYSSASQAVFCPIDSPPKWPAFLQVPAPQYRAVAKEGTDLPSASCRDVGSCPVSFLYTAQNRSFAEGMVPFFFQMSNFNLSDPLLLSDLTPGSSSWTFSSNFIEPAILSPGDSYAILPNCSSFSNGIPFSFSLGSESVNTDIKCAEPSFLWRESYNLVNDDLYKGFRGGNPRNEINEISAAYDFGSTSAKKFDVTIAFNATYKNDTGESPPGLVRVSRSMNLAAQAFLRMLQGADAKLPLWFIAEMPKVETQLKLDFASLLGPLFFMWVIQLLLPVIMTYLVYEKQYRLRIMMKMHGLGDGPYWLISYGYFLVLSIVYMFCFILFGSLIGLKFFRLNSYSLQVVFYFIYLNLQIACGFLASTIFSNVRTATVIGYMYVFGFGLLGNFLFEYFVQDQSFSEGAIFAMELLPGFSLYRGLLEFSQYAFIGNYKGTSGIQWSNLNDPENGLKTVMSIMAVEWLLFLLIAFYLDQVVVSGSGLKKDPLFFLKGILGRNKGSKRTPSFKVANSQIKIDLQKQDIGHERESVERALSHSGPPHAIVCDEIRKVYPGRDGNPPKFAVKGLSLAIPRGECFGMLGPNGAGKTTSISMMTGLLAPTSGTIYIEGLDIQENVDKIYSCMGVCPQHDLLWETLTGREHLLFYGRLKNLKGAELSNAVDASLRSVNLFNGGVGDKRSGKYSGGMKRRLSVAISLIGDPKVVYMDEPSTGLDPASRSNLWDVVREAKRNRAIILTTHSMEEAEILCDRLGIFVDGELQCIGNSKELKSRYGGSYVFSIKTDQSEEGRVMDMVQRLSPNARRVYNLSGTQKFEVPKLDVRIADIFRAVEHAKREFSIQAWGFADTTLEDVFIKVARDVKDTEQ
ncbi:hypothetical protein GOP47_0010483 [Adiantum capillus-veneris]|uniref:ABC transporter domain-containing protein n=1 Tax=Adiantum capillus-veneris TaxID=13818 RepID=A0A9D4UVD3_ADICA|nr:hypothetical protein GOP47_0010483 [Adiantum capillus-veneris]